MDINERVEKLENEVSQLRLSISEIQTGIREIKVMLQERPIQEQLKNNLIEKDVKTLSNRIQKIEDSNTWLSRTIAGSIIAIIIEAVFIAIKMM